MTDYGPMKIPAWLKPGDRMRVIAPSGGIRNLEQFEKGLAFWRSQDFEIIVGQNVRKRVSYLAGSDAQRLADWKIAWNDPDCRAILCARGGYGTARLLNYGWQVPADSTPKWVLGFSDITTLLWALVSQGIVSLHGPVLTTISDEPKWSLERVLNFIVGNSIDELSGQSWRGGVATGRLLPANLVVSTYLLGTPWLPSLDGAILAFEEINEPPYKLDRLITAWHLNGALKNIAGVALGRFSGCDGADHSWTATEVLRDRLGCLSIPIVADLPFGHGGPNALLPVGLTATLDGNRGTLRIEN
ncbi:MAG: LD-carboxypeptidase [Cyanobacteria bacterium P01_H01_bin.15]